MDPVPPLGAHEYVYPGVPPVADTVAEPLLPPWQETFVCEETVAVMAEGAVIEKVCEPMQPIASWKLQVYVPAERPVAVAAFPPLGDQL